ncbi:MAG TPA: hypothetical protein VNH18_23185, partial [Bryobacteraceae bacterium]|nr:hypothetical protein [Bryobacteraceae bacterium]
AGSLNVAILGVVVFGLGRGAYDCNAMPVLRDVAGDSRSATGYGLLNMAGTIVGGVAVGTVGYLKQHIGLSSALQAAALMLALGALALFFARPSHQTAQRIDGECAKRSHL